MDFFTNLVVVIQKMLMLGAAGFGIAGLVQLAEANSEQNPAAKVVAYKMLSGAIGLVLIAQAVIPSLKTFFTVG